VDGRFFYFQMRAELQTVLTLARTLDAAEVADFLGDLETIRVVALGVLMKPQPAPLDELLDIKECARRMHTSKDWLYRHSDKLKFARRVGRKLLFSSAGLNDYLRKSR
jgi:hypothetical protein